MAEFLHENTLLATLGIELIEASKDQVVASMPVTSKVHQPFGLLHGGASVALAESVASIGASLNIDLAKKQAVGLEINANHVRPKRSGLVTAVGKPLHIGRSTQIWLIDIKDEQEKLICTSRCTLAIIDH